jgi:hypothetical protein
MVDVSIGNHCPKGRLRVTDLELIADVLFPEVVQDLLI